MATYQVTIEFTTRLSREVETHSAAEAEPLADEMFQGFLKGENAHVIGTETIGALSCDPPRSPVNGSLLDRRRGLSDSKRSADVPAVTDHR
jgi:hypothetical protein